MVLHADSLSAEQKQRIAAKLGLSETAFVSDSQVGDVKVAFFTPNRQIPHCGHATVATFGLLLQKGMVQEPGAVKESIEGPRRIDLVDNKIYQSQLPPKFIELPLFDVNPADVTLSLGLPEAYVFAAPLVIGDTGIPFLLVALPDEKVLQDLQPVQERIAAISDKLGLVGYYVFTTATAGADATTRMFAPSYGIPEEAATGMAAGPLACYLHNYLGKQKDRFLIHQGYLMQPASPSQIEVQLTLDAQGRISALKAGGPAYVVQQLALDCRM